MANANKPLATAKFSVEAEAVEFLYPYVLELNTPKYLGTEGKPCYSVNAAFSPDHPDLKVLKTTLAKLRTEAFGNGEAAKLVKLPLKSGDVKADASAKSRKVRGKEPHPVDEAMRGKSILFASSEKYRPTLAYIEGGKAVAVSEELRSTCQRFFSGSRGSLTITLAAWPPSPMTPNGSIKAYLNSVCASAGGTRLTGDAATRYDTFAKNVGTVSDVDPTDEDIEADIEI